MRGLSLVPSGGFAKCGTLLSSSWMTFRVAWSVLESWPAGSTPNPPLAALSGAANDLQVAETAALTRATGTVATRNEKRAALVTLLEVLRSYVQSVADASPEKRRGRARSPARGS
jgi:hypothetical protein